VCKEFSNNQNDQENGIDYRGNEPCVKLLCLSFIRKRGASYWQKKKNVSEEIEGEVEENERRGKN
jgi:hypothetical protein